MSEVSAPKSGFKTSEFYMTLATSITGILVMMGYLEPQQATELSEAIVSVIGGVMVVVSFSLYIYSRIKAKQNVAVPSTQVNTVLAIPGLEEPDNLPQSVPFKAS